MPNTAWADRKSPGSERLTQHPSEWKIRHPSNSLKKQCPYLVLALYSGTWPHFLAIELQCASHYGASSILLILFLMLLGSWWLLDSHYTQQLNTYLKIKATWFHAKKRKRKKKKNSPAQWSEFTKTEIKSWSSYWLPLIFILGSPKLSQVFQHEFSIRVYEGSFFFPFLSWLLWCISDLCILLWGSEGCWLCTAWEIREEKSPSPVKPLLNWSVLQKYV